MATFFITMGIISVATLSLQFVCYLRYRSVQIRFEGRTPATQSI